METRPNLIFVTRRPPWPLDNGARIRSARLAGGLAPHFKVTLVTFLDGPAWDDTVATSGDLEALLPDARIELVPFLGDRRPVGVRRNLFRARSAGWGVYTTPTLRQTLARLIAEMPDAVLHLDDPGIGPAGLGLAPGRTAYAPHNIEHRIFRDIAAGLRPERRLFLAAEWRKVAREERRCWQEADLCVAVSEIDAKTMRDGGAREIVQAPNGSDPHEQLPARRREPGDPLRLLFVGSGSFWPYERGLTWFASEVMPRLRERADVVFDVVGEPPTVPITAEGVTVHGRVPDVRPFYEAADALIVPVFEGSGTRLKIVEAGLLGRPVISTALGAEGLPVTAGRHYRLAESPDEWVAAVEELSRGELAPMVGPAREAVQALTWPRIAAQLGSVYLERLGRSR